MNQGGFVLDASIAVAWAFDDEDLPSADDAMDRLVDGFALVPPLWHVELANVLAVGLRRERIDADGVRDFLVALDRLDIRTEIAPPDTRRLVAESVDRGLSAYDSTYLLLAHDRGLPLATGDRQLARAAEEAGIPLLRG